MNIRAKARLQFARERFIAAEIEIRGTLRGYLLFLRSGDLNNAPSAGSRGAREKFRERRFERRIFARRLLHLNELLNKAGVSLGVGVAAVLEIMDAMII